MRIEKKWEEEGQHRWGFFEETFWELSRGEADFVVGMNTIKNRDCCMGEGG